MLMDKSNSVNEKFQDKEVEDFSDLNPGLSCKMTTTEDKLNLIVQIIYELLESFPKGINNLSLIKVLRLTRKMLTVWKDSQYP